MSTNDKSNLEYKKLYTKLDALAAKYGSSGDVFYEIYTESLDRGPDYVKNRIESTNSAFDTATDADKEAVMKLLAEIHAAKAQQKESAKKDKETPTLEDVLNLEDYVGEEEIVNYIVLHKVVNGTPQNFYVKVQLVNGEIEMALTHSRAILTQTAPSLDFFKKEYGSLNNIYTELRERITNYIAFPSDSIAPDLIALGSTSSYFREAYYTFPYFDFISSEPAAGKTTALKVQTFTSFYGTIAASITEALLFREIDGSHCFYGLDNIERLFVSPKDYAAIIDWLLSSYSRDIPCKRLEKTDEGYEVRYFDGYGIKAFTHIKDFPYVLRALRSRCIQIVMQTGKPGKFYPSAEKFTEIRDKLYKARLYEFEAIKESYENLIKTNVLTGRTGDLYYPLLSIAKLVDEKLYQRVLSYAVSDEMERIERDSWNKALITVLISEKKIGSISATEIRPLLEVALRAEGLIKADKELYTKTVTSRLKKLGFKREDRKTENKTWFLIDKEKLMLKAHEYNIIDEDELEKFTKGSTPKKPNLSNLSNFGEEQDKPKEGSTEGGGEDKQGTDEIDLDSNGRDEELTKLGKLAKRGVCESTIKSISPAEKALCEYCGEERFLDHVWTHEGDKCFICSKCSVKLKGGGIR